LTDETAGAADGDREPTSDRIPLFTFDEVRRFEIEAINKRRERRGLNHVGLPRGREEIRREEVSDFHSKTAPLSNNQIQAAIQQNLSNSRQETTDPRFTRPEPVANDMTGLSLSGGGIRSAAFSLGALQALHARGALNEFDFISTVSGGGYIGASLTAAMSVNDGKFPFSTGKADIRDADSVGHIRNYSNYLMPRNQSFFQNAGEAAAVVLRGLISNIVMLAPLLMLAALLSAYLFTRSGGFKTGFIAAAIGLVEPDHPNSVIVASLLLVALLIGLGWATLRDLVLRGSVDPFSMIFIALTALTTVVFLLVIANSERAQDAVGSVAQRISLWTFSLPLVLVGALAALLICWSLLRSVPWYLGRDVGSFYLRLSSALLWTIVACVVLEAIPFLMRWMLAQGPVTEGGTLNLAGIEISDRTLLVLFVSFAFASAISIVSERLEAIGEGKGKSSKRLAWFKKMAAKTLLLAAAAVFPITTALVFGWFAAFCVEADQTTRHALLIASVLLIPIAVAMGPNSYSLHRFYRDRLETAFLSPEALFPKTHPILKIFHGVRPMRLSDLKTDRAPYHLVNTALNLQGSETANQRGREADFFTFSPQFVGSDLTFYAPARADKIRLFKSTPDIEKVEKTLDLASVVAISGAAVSANMGSSTIRVLTPTLAFLNVRLGYWLVNPRSPGRLQTWYWKLLLSKFYLPMEMLGLLNERRNQLYLTDGGHLENLGIYQLLKRGCQLIFAIDAEADPELTFGSLLKLERFARIDLGVRIELPWEQIASVARDGWLRTPSGRHWGENGPHCAVGRILYPDGSEGILVYVKASVTGDERDYILDYKRRNPSFPHEKTSDQFFTEEQFEVYRALGFHTVDGLLAERDDVAIDGDPRKGSKDLNEFYRQLRILLPGASFGPTKDDGQTI